MKRKLKMGKFKEKLKGRRQSKNIEDVRTDPISKIIGSDKKKLEDQDLQEIKGRLSVHLKDKKPMAEQESDSYTKFRNKKGTQPERMMSKAKKLIRLKDDIFPKEYSKLKNE